MTSPRKRGGQPHNRNAVKNGFYARQFDRTDLADLSKIEDPAGLDAEIALMRVTLRRLTQASRGLTDFESLARFSRSISYVTLALTRLMKARILLQDKSAGTKEVADAIAAIMDDVEAASLAKKENNPFPPLPQPINP